MTSERNGPRGNGRVEAHPVRSLRLYSALAAANAAILRATDRDEVFRRVCEVAVSAGGFGLAWVGERTEEGCLRPVASVGLGSEEMWGETVNPDTQVPSALALTHGEPNVCHDMSTDPAFAPHWDRIAATGHRSTCSVPIHFYGEVIGTLSIYDREVGAFDAPAVHLLGEMAADVSVALALLEQRRTQAEALAAAERSEAHLQSVLALGHDVVGLFDRDGQGVWLSDSSEAVVGHPSSYYVGQLLADEVHPDDLPVVLQRWSAVVDRPGATAVLEMRLRHQDGSWRWMELHITNRTDQLGPDGYVTNMHDITERRRTADELRFHADLLSSVGQAVIATDRAARITYFNRAAEELLGRSADEVMGRSAIDVAPVVGSPQHADRVLRAMRSGSSWNDEIEVRHHDGRLIPVAVHNTPILDGEGRLVGIIGVSSDISDKVLARRQLEARAAMQAEVARLGQVALSHADLATVVEEATAGIASVLGLEIAMFVELAHDAEGRTTAHGATVRSQVGAATAREGRPLDPNQAELLEAFLPLLHDQLVVDDLPNNPLFAPMVARLVAPIHAVVAVEVPRRGVRYGVLAGFSLSRRDLGDDEANFIRALGNIVASKIEQRDAEAELRDMALHDALTRLPNRTLLVDRIKHAMARTERDGGTVAVLLVDLDGFKLVNDALGHHVGDQLLVAVAGRLTQAVRAGDTVARLGGDEFAVLCDDTGSVAEATLVAERIAELIAAPFSVEGVETYVTASIGITVRVGESAPAEVLLREADGAMYRAKEAGRSRYEVFDEAMREMAVHRFDLTNAMRRAIEREEFRLVWQPELAMAAGPGAGLWVEALVRWEHPELGLIGPAEFIDLAESNGLINPIGEWVLAEACRTMVAWRSSGGPAPAMFSVNLSARQLAQPDLVDRIAAVLDDTGVDPSMLMLEITETAVMGDPVGSAARLDSLRALGVSIAIDDFGTGYSSLTYLRRLPVDALKIDRSFVSGLTDSLRDRAIVEGIIALAHAVDLIVIAEGVESEAQACELRELGCDWAQGYLWSPPVGAHALQDWMAEQGMTGG